VVQAQPPDAKGGKGAFKGGGGYAPKNLQVLDKNTFPNSMQAFVQALGVADKGRCNYCHVEGDKASDDKMQKVIARNMILMVRQINMQFPDAKQQVTCWTCHRGSTTPVPTP
jgi:photosynthetic reaction center cytochrome c subunit